MPPEQRPPDDPLEWLNRAKSNLTRAKNPIPGVYLEDLCFDAHQAAEKAIKALLIHAGIAFPYIHDLGALISLIEAKGDTVSHEVRQAERLTRFASPPVIPGSPSPWSRKNTEERSR